MRTYLMKNFAVFLSNLDTKTFANAFVDERKGDTYEVSG